MGQISLNGIRFEAPDTWVFYKFADLLLGRPVSRAGVIQISAAFRDAAKTSTDHRSCMEIAHAWAGVCETPSQEIEVDLDGALFGAFSCRIGIELKQVWYKLEGGKLILGMFACPWDRREPPEVQQALAEADVVMRTARYEIRD